MLKSFFPEICPNCNEPLTVKVGDKSDTLKLMCTNSQCSGALLKRLQKGIIALEIRGLGPKVIENLMGGGITSSLDLFDPEKFNETSLISSGYFRKGRSLEKIMTSVRNTKSIDIQKIILSLQIDDIGKTVSRKLGEKMSGLNPDFAGLPYSVRDNMTEIIEDLKLTLDKFYEFGLEIVKIEPPKKVVATKKVTKRVASDGMDPEIMVVVANLGWEIAAIENDCDFLIVHDKNADTEEIRKAKELNVKIMTLKTIKLLFC